MGKPLSIIGAISAKPAPDDIRGNCRRDVRWFSPILAELQKIFPGQKFAADVGALANRSTRVVEEWKARRAAPDGQALAALLNSRHGDRLWRALTKGNQEPWRKNLDRQIEISQLRDQQRETARRLEALERGDQ